MDYTTVDNILRVLPIVGSVTNVMSADLAAFAVDAESIVNAKLSRLYTVPVGGSPPILKKIATELTLYDLLTRRTFVQEQPNNSDWPNRYKEAMELLEQIATGEVLMVTSSGTSVPTKTSGAPIWSNTMGYTPTMNEDGDVTSVVDLDKLDDIASDRV